MPTDYEELDKYLKTVIWDVPDAVIINMIKNGCDNSHTLMTTLYPNLDYNDNWDWWEWRKRYQFMYRNLRRLETEGWIYRKRTLKSAIIWGVH